jgi:pyrimidine-nucleoside phosphorylase
MSKKIAAGAQAILLDVKVGRGAFITNLKEAEQMAELMVEIGCQVGRKTIAILSDMNQPLGEAVGNSLELVEALATLKGSGPEDFKEHCMVICGYLLRLGGVAEDEKQGRVLTEEAIRSGRALECFRNLVEAQGGAVDYLDHPEKLPRARYIREVKSPRSGYLAEIDACEAGKTVVLLGGGRAQKGDTIDYSVGLIVSHKVGDWVKEGDVLFTVHANDKVKLEQAITKMLDAHQWSTKPVQPLPQFYGTIG